MNPPCDTGQPPAWLQITATTAQAALAEAVFEHHGADAVTVLDAGTEMAVENSPNEQPTFQTSRVVGLFPDTTAAEPIITDLQSALGTAAEITSDALENRDWASAWRACHPPLRFGSGLWIAPHDTVVDNAPEATVVRLDPGLAFGTGTHATTALCLEWLAATDMRGRHVLDYGCGSGILAIAAAALGAETVTAVDTDGQAVRATRDNADRNGVGTRIHTPPIDDIGSVEFDIVLANILAKPLIALAPTLMAHAAPGAALVLAGLLGRQADAVKQAYNDAFVFGEGAARGDWLRLDAQRR